MRTTLKGLMRTTLKGLLDETYTDLLDAPCVTTPQPFRVTSEHAGFFFHRLHVTACAKRLARACKDDDANVFIPIRLPEQAAESGDHLIRKRVVMLNAVERDPQ